MSKSDDNQTKAAKVKVPPGMVEVVANRDFTLRTLTGNTVHFEEDKPKFIAKTLLPEAMKFGVVPTNPKAMDKPEADESKETPQGGDRQLAIQNVLKEIVEKNDRNDFGANSRPKLAVVKDMLGFDLHQKELDAVWEALNAQ